MGEGPIGSNGACSTLCWFSVTPSATHKQSGPFWCWFLSGWVCVSSRPLWVSPKNSPVRLGVSPASAATLTGVFNQWFEALFPSAGALGCEACFAPPQFLLVYLCMNVGLLCPPATAWRDPPAAPCQPAAALTTLLYNCHLAGSSSHHLVTSPLCLVAHLRPSYQSGWMFLLYLLGCWTSIQFDFLSVLVVFCF